ncbi:hypothetical protein BH09SUM1_BH09SUM1_18460 [soil metagenome]
MMTESEQEAKPLHDAVADNPIKIRTDEVSAVTMGLSRVIIAFFIAFGVIYFVMGWVLPLFSGMTSAVLAIFFSAMVAAVVGIFFAEL